MLVILANVVVESIIVHSLLSVSYFILRAEQIDSADETAQLIEKNIEGNRVSRTHRATMTRTNRFSRATSETLRCATRTIAPVNSFAVIDVRFLVHRWHTESGVARVEYLYPTVR